MSLPVQEILQGVAVAATGVGAVTDWRTGKIPNALTFGALAIGPVAAAATWGFRGLVESLLGVCFCGLVPFVGFRMKAMGGGDVKLFAATGGLLGPWIGIEAQFYSMLVASFAALVLLLVRGKLLQVFANIFFLAFNRFLPKHRRRKVTPDAQTKVRLGPFIFVGTTLAVLLQHPHLIGVRP